MASGYLKVKGNQIVDETGATVILRGCAIGGWLKYVHNQYMGSMSLTLG